MIKIMFVCHGNICRSPMAEMILKDMVRKRGIADRFVIASSATSTEEIWGDTGSPVYPPARAMLKKKDIPCEDHHAVQIRKSDYAAYDYIIAMEQFNLRNMRSVIGSDPDQKVYRMLDFTGTPRDVSDPWFSGDFESAYNDISRGCAAFLDYLEGRGLL
ncbi:MAG: low molecular weight protein-tyrosine-phosphatase [Acutalibacteraceae bacterium]|nr:low molecular weight protein-tyrosine-phosphatase [Acutalibacteraceae bacterium]